MRYEVVAGAYRDLEQATGRLALVDRLAALLAQTPAELLAPVCYLCQGLIAPEFAGVDLGLAEKLAVRAVATASRSANRAGLSFEPAASSTAARSSGSSRSTPTGGSPNKNLTFASSIATLHAPGPHRVPHHRPHTFPCFFMWRCRWLA